MADPYSTLSNQDQQVQNLIADAMDTRGGEDRQQEMLREYLEKIPFPDGAKVLDVGCGTGVLSGIIANWLGVGETIGVEPASELINRAMERHSGAKNLTFQQGDGRALPFGEGEFDAVIYHTVLCHAPEPEDLLTEAYRVLKPGGALAVFDGDYVDSTVALGEDDPLQACMNGFINGFVHDKWIMRRMPLLIRQAGFEITESLSHGYMQTSYPGYVKTMIDRGTDLLLSQGIIGEALAAAIKDETRVRAEAGKFKGFVPYGSHIARKT